MTSRRSEHPQPARLVVRVGVTGHRPDALEELGADMVGLRKRVNEILKRVRLIVDRIHEDARDVYTREEPLLRLISPLAEGADRLVAEEALALDYELQCILPFPREEYEEDFRTRPGSKEHFELL